MEPNACTVRVGQCGCSVLLWAAITRVIEHWISHDPEAGPLVKRTWQVRGALRKKIFRNDGYPHLRREDLGKSGRVR